MNPLVNCIFPYALGLSGYCVNTLLDYNNCGAVGNSCSVPNTSCSAGACSNVPMVQLANSTSIWTGGVNGSADDLLFNVTLPFPITLYSTTTNQIQVTSNGVSCLFIIRYCIDRYTLSHVGSLFELLLEYLDRWDSASQFIRRHSFSVLG